MTAFSAFLNEKSGSDRYDQSHKEHPRNKIRNRLTYYNKERHDKTCDYHDDQSNLCRFAKVLHFIFPLQITICLRLYDTTLSEYTYQYYAG